MKKTKSLGCSQEIFYTVSTKAWEACRANVDAFKNFKVKYNPSFINQAIADINTAKAMKDTSQRKGPGKLTRIRLEASTALNRNNWQELKSYILEAYDTRTAQSNLIIAGSLFYEKASGDNWSAVRSLVEKGMTFINNNLSELSANDNMPPTFQTKFTTDSSDFLALSADFYNKEDQGFIETGEKAAANEAIYLAVTSMLKDGQLIFRKDSKA